MREGVCIPQHDGLLDVWMVSVAAVVDGYARWVCLSRAQRMPLPLLCSACCQLLHSSNNNLRVSDQAGMKITLRQTGLAAS